MGYRVCFIIALFIGSVMNLALVWNLADCMNALMAIPNLLSLIFLSGIIVHETRKFLWRNRLDKSEASFCSTLRSISVSSNTSSGSLYHLNRAS